MIYLVIGIILLIFLAIAFLIGILTYYWFFSKDEEKKAWVFIDIAGRLKHKKGILLEKTSQGESWLYGNKETVIVPNDPKSYPIKYWKRRRKIDVLNGNMYASPIGYWQTETDTGKIQLIQDLTLSHIGRDMIGAMSSNKLNLGLIIVIVVIVAIAIGGGMFLFNRQSQAGKIQSTPAPAQTLPPSGEVTK